MSIVYIISTVMLMISTILVKRSDKKQDIIRNIAIMLVLFLCYQTAICYLFTLLHIPITLLSLSLVNIVVSAVFIGKMIHQKQIQPYQFDAKDTIYIVVLIFVVFLLSYFDFGIPLGIKYLSTDSSIHYISAREFYENESLLSEVKNTYSSNAMMPGAYSNIGILFKTLAPWVGEMNLYQVFIGFDIFTLFLSGMLFFVTIKPYAKNKLTYGLVGVISIIYLLGYPLNNMLFGYFYLGIGVLVINAILAVMQDWKKEELHLWQKGIALFLLCFELFFSYYLFAPPVYAAIFVYYVFYFHKTQGKWISKTMLICTLITLVIPTIMGFCYHVLPGMLVEGQLQVSEVIQMEGYIYRNLYSNVILFLPFVIYYFVREKKLQFDVIGVVILLIYMCVLYIGIFKLHISTYYFFKTYFALWLLILYLFFKGACYLNEHTKYGNVIISVYIGIYVLLMVVSFFTSDVKITKETLNRNEKITDVMDIYGINKTVLFRIATDYTYEELEILNYVKENKLPLANNNTLLIANQRQEYWFFAILQYRYKENLNYATTTKHIEKWNNGTYEYLIYFNRSEYYNEYKDRIDFSDSDVIFENESGAIIKKSLKYR